MQCDIPEGFPMHFGEGIEQTDRSIRCSAPRPRALRTSNFDCVTSDGVEKRLSPAPSAEPIVVPTVDRIFPLDATIP
jgi:hypothetical protein